MAASRNAPSPEDALLARASAVLEAAGVGAGQVVCVALSGGVDSTVLLHALAILRRQFHFELLAAHVHHGLSPNADAWEAACGRLCRALDVPLHLFRVDVARDHPAGLEAAARAARHAALAGVTCDWLATGHHQDDQAETVLFRLLRGAGLRGAAAMARIDPGRPGRIRPFLDLRRSDILAYAQAHGLAWVEDESNADWRHARNHLRHRVMPALSAVAPGAVPALARAAENFREGERLLGELAAIDADACGSPRLCRSALLALSDERLRNLLRWEIERMGVPPPARARLCEAVRQLRASAPGHPLRLDLDEAACCVYRDAVWLERTQGAALPGALLWRGQAELPWGGGVVRFESVRGEGLSRAGLTQASGVELVPPWSGLVMRQGARRPRRSFKKLCQEAGVPAWLRPGLPVLRVAGQAVWIGGIGMAPEFACPADEPGVQLVWMR